jgi:predicted ribosomally synthesized peptide with nif11-like leader
MKEALARFQAALEKDAALRDELARQGSEPARQALWARGQGYDVTTEEIAGLAQEEELSDDDLEQVAGGWDGVTPPRPDGG